MRKISVALSDTAWRRIREEALAQRLTIQQYLEECIALRGIDVRKLLGQDLPKVSERYDLALKRAKQQDKMYKDSAMKEWQEDERNNGNGSRC